MAASSCEGQELKCSYSYRKPLLWVLVLLDSFLVERVLKPVLPATVEGRRGIFVLLSFTREMCGQIPSLRLGGLDLGVVVRPMVFSNQRINKRLIYEQEKEAFCEPCDAQKYDKIIFWASTPRRGSIFRTATTFPFFCWDWQTRNYRQASTDVSTAQIKTVWLKDSNSRNSYSFIEPKFQGTTCRPPFYGLMLLPLVDKSWVRKIMPENALTRNWIKRLVHTTDLNPADNGQ